MATKGNQSASAKSETSEKSAIFDKVKHVPNDGLQFKGNSTEATKQEVKLTNGSEKTVAYKLKGTSPDFIKIKPNYGFLKPKSSVKIKVKLMPWKDQEDKLGRNNRVTILLSVAPSGGSSNAKQFWQSASSSNPVRRVIPVVLEASSTGSSTPSSKNSNSSQRKQKDRFTSEESQDESDSEASSTEESD